MRVMLVAHKYTCLTPLPTGAHCHHSIVDIRHHASVATHHMHKTLLPPALGRYGRLAFPIDSKKISFEPRVLFLVVVILLIAYDRLICFLRLIHHLSHRLTQLDIPTTLSILPFSFWPARLPWLLDLRDPTRSGSTDIQHHVSVCLSPPPLGHDHLILAFVSRHRVLLSRRKLPTWD